jgi:hypothetical protein
MALSLANLQPLLEEFKGDGLVVTCYADLSATPGFPVRWPGSFKVKAAAIKEMLADDPRAWNQFERNFEAVGRALVAPEARRARGMAIFSALQRGFFQPIALDVPMKNELVVHGAPYLVPLLQALCRQREYLVVLTDTHRGRLFAATPGSVRLLQEIEATVPKRQHSAGECWGMAQATIARHREDCIHHYQKELIELAEKAWAAHPFQGLVLLGEHEVLEHVRKRLPQRLASQVVHQGPHAWTENPLAVAEPVRVLLADVEQCRERRFMEGLAEHLQQDHAVAAGAGAVVDALQSWRVGARGHGYLLLGPDRREAVSRCTACRFLSAEMPTACPRCQAPCVEASLWEEILLFALRHDSAVYCIEAEEPLARYDGLAAVIPEREASRQLP